MSCAYDALFSTLWIIYSIGREEVEVTFNVTLPLMAKMFRDMIDNKVSFKKANDIIRDTYFIKSRVRDYSRGVYQDISTITTHLQSQCVLSVDENENDCFMLQYHCKKKCTNALCLNISKEFVCERVLRLFYFGGDIDTTQTVPQMINQYFGLENRNYRCQVCEHQMIYSNILVSIPLILCICFN
jgi:hypothetical protein